ncbi:NFACT RNA binding domain-containing protein [Moorena producens JHB]|uniref:Rqc2 homolog RqcH n=1 Tax=Moorena producens (strain JHB) TaxID=1454205 RepID=A0A9Q9UVD6_MOOP1|nr:NFACT RNA binding domain-containing protein [Moorena producens]WAN68719.1 NFACT RNA binding domain-containing protein [Moorena producens JHB]
MQPVDYTTLTAACSELLATWVPGRTEQVYQRDRYTIAIALRTLNGRGWLTICWHPQAARICIGDPPPRVPDTFTFSDQLRHQLGGFALIAIETIAPWERVLDLQFAKRPGEPPTWHLYVEIIGKYSNLILTDADNLIVTTAHQVSNQQSSVRTIQTGQPYELPPALTGTTPSLTEPYQSWQERVSLIPGAVAHQLLKSYRGLSPTLARSMVQAAGLDPKQSTENLEESDWQNLFQRWQQWLQTLLNASKFSTDNLQPVNLQPTNLGQKATLREQPANLGQKATLREQPTNLQPSNLGQKATLREQPTNLGQKATLREQPTNLGQKATLREQPSNLQPSNLGQKATLREQPTNLGQKATLREQPTNLGQKATLREQPTNLGQKATLREQPTNLGQKATLREQPTNLGQKATLREQPTNLGQKATLREQPTNLGQKATLREQPTNLGQKATLREQPANLKPANLQPANLFQPGWTNQGYTVMDWGIVKPAENIQTLLNSYYTNQLNQHEFSRLHNQLTQKLNNSLRKLGQKASSFKERLQQSDQADQSREKADLLMAYLQDWQPGMKSITLLDFETNQPVKIPLNPEKNAVQNAQAFYKRHQKLKRTRDAVEPLLKEVQDEIQYLEQVEASLTQLNTYNTLDDLQTLQEIREELIGQGYLEASAQRSRNLSNVSQPYRYQTPSGFELLIGRNNRQNDQLTFRTAGDYDLWFHTQEIAGSHVLLRLEPGTVADPADLQFAADLAAYNSRGCQSEQVPVVYTKPKYVYKPKGAKPGMAIYKHEQILWGRPDQGRDYLMKSASTQKM